MDQQILITAFIAASTLVLIVYLLVAGRRGGAVADLGVATADTAAADFAVAATRTPRDPNKQIKHRLVQAGWYTPGAHAAFVIARIIVAAVPLAICMLAAGAEMMTRKHAILYGSIVGLTGTVVPSLWLDARKRGRQRQIRRALPDALDVVAVCLEGGLSLPASLARVGRELESVHPMLAMELSIVDREIHMGRTTGDAMRQFAERFDLEELRSLASVISQTERFGASVARAFVVYSETLRLRRAQLAEELARTASVKILFPTLLCIFPGIFLVLLGPAAIQIYHTLVQNLVLPK